ncbi:MAG: hypothetical protein Q7R57_04145 [Dehalococcoidales bacterium]|nr:hypothetical protein [Dehalococcoidales bacterium]
MNTRKSATVRQSTRRPVVNTLGTTKAASGLNRPSAQAISSQLLLSLERELKLARQIRAEAEQYRLQTGLRARSEAQQLMLDTRLSLKKEISRLESETSEQISKLLAAIRIIHLAAREELEAQRQFTSAAKINALSSTIKEEANTE